jgi:hypothetical protein
MDSQTLLAMAVIVAVQVGLAVWVKAALGAEDAERPGGRRTDLEGPPVRRADDLRSYQAVASEVAKRQVGVLADMAEELQEYDRACLAHARRICELMIAEWRRAGFSAIPDQLPNDLDGAMRMLARLRERSLDEAAQERIRKDLEPNTTVLLAYAEQTTSRLEENRFWLGRVLEQELRAYVGSMAAIFSELRPAAESLRAGEDRYRAVVRTHPEASRAIEWLSAGGLSAAPSAR